MWFPFRKLFALIPPFHFAWMTTVGGVVGMEIWHKIKLRRMMKQIKQFNSETSCRFVVVGEVMDRVVLKVLGPSFGPDLAPLQSNSEERPRTSSSFASAIERVEIATALLQPWCREDSTRMAFAIGTSMVLASSSSDLYCTHVVMRDVVAGVMVEACSAALPLNVYLRQVEEMDRDAIFRAWAQF